MKLIPDLREFIELLNLENVQYLVIGGWAYNRYAEPRMTGDIDFFVDSSEQNQSKLRIVLEKFGFGQTLPPQTKPLFEKKIIMLGRPPHRIDLLIEISGVAFKDAYKRRENGILDDVPVGYISKEDLIQNKRAAGRDKDIADVKALQSMPSKKATGN